ncbi:uncharacterized protein TNCV_2482841 [Trichonephila clavipes]|uniref:RNase H type-1 domain-containing protein n=1 Tax=Trichonephila clavipes TaxID=2585209 RepID=A0A8X6VZ01_TRICX|nr:uncharacterized protein TNCV_2482841 [Trichonephila clavipes]
MPKANKMSDHPELLMQLALEVIDGIPLDAAKIYTDGSKGETNTTGSGVLIELPGHVIKFQRNADHSSVFRTELIAIMCGLSFINNIRDLAFSEIWILTDSRSSIQTFIKLAIYRRQHQEYFSPFSTTFGSAPYSSTVGPFSCRPSRERSCGRPCEDGYQQSCGSGRPHGPYIGPGDLPLG